MIEFLGDANNDGRITLEDAILALQLASSMYTDVGAEKRADIDRSGDVSMSDVNAIINHLKGVDVIFLDF